MVVILKTIIKKKKRKESQSGYNLYLIKGPFYLWQL